MAKLAPRVQLRNPIYLGLYIASVFATLLGLATIWSPWSGTRRTLFSFTLAAWFWLSLLLADFAEVLADDWAKARSARLHSTGTPLQAKRLLDPNRNDFSLVAADTLRRGDVVLVEANDIIPADGTVIKGAAAVNEGPITGESAPVLRAPGGAAFVHRGTQVLSDSLVVRVRSRDGFFDPIATISQANPRPRTAGENALSGALIAATMAFITGSVALAPAAGLAVLVALLVCALPIATGACVSAIAWLEMARLRRANVIATSGGAVEAAADIDILVLDKTGTVTRGDRHAAAFHAAPGVAARELLEAARLASLADQTPEGRSIVALVSKTLAQPPLDTSDAASTFHEFSAQTRISGIDLGIRSLRKGAVDAVRRFVERAGGSWPTSVSTLADDVARTGASPLVVADGPRVLGVIELRDLLKGGIREHSAALRSLGIRTYMVTGDNKVTAMAIAAEIGVDDFVAEATPEKKRELIKTYQNRGYRVAMCGDGTNDAPALAQADVAMTMSSGTAAARQVCSLIALDSDPTSFVAIVAAGKRMLAARRSLTVFASSADLVKYLTILPVVFAYRYPGLHALNFEGFTTPQGAMLAALLLTAVIVALFLIVAIADGAARTGLPVRILHGNRWIYGFGGVLLAWVGITLIKDVLRASGLT